MNEFEYTCAPKTNVKGALSWIAVCLGTGSILYCLSFDQNAISPWFRVMGAVLFMAAVLLTVRFLGTRYVYRLSVDVHGVATFTVYELRGYFGKESRVKSSGAICRVDTTDISELVSSSDRKNHRALKKRAKRERTSVYNYCAADFVRSHMLMRVTDGSCASLVKFSPDEKMKELIKNHCSFEYSVIQ